MPIQKYYCDYCDKQFQDTPAARKRHLDGLQHQRAKKLWYDSFKEPYGENPARGVCTFFVRKGFCQYGDSCRYLHPMQNIQQHGVSVPVQSDNYSNMQVMTGNSIQSANAPVNSRSTTPLSGPCASIQVPISLLNLPPSLRPPPEGGYPLPFIDWG